MRQQPKVPWQVKYVALVLIWGSSFLLMKVGLEHEDPAKIEETLDRLEKEAGGNAA